MTHFTCVVIGGDIEQQLAPYDENIRVEPYRDYDEDEWILRRAEQLGLDPTDLPVLAHGINVHYELSEDDKDAYHVDEHGLYTMSTYNPESKWDWYQIGGRWSGYFITKDGRNVDQALKGEVDWEKMRGDEDSHGFTVALVGEGVYQAEGHVGWFGYVDKTEEEAWKKRWWDVIDGLPDDVMLTLVDMHI